jgi:hypothetical protein
VSDGSVVMMITGPVLSVVTGAPSHASPLATAAAMLATRDDFPLSGEPATIVADDASHLSISQSGPLDASTSLILFDPVRNRSKAFSCSGVSFVIVVLAQDPLPPDRLV